MANNLTSKLAVREAAIMGAMPLCKADIAKAIGRAPSLVTTTVNRMHAEGRVFISGWRRGKHGGPFIAIYSVKTGPAQTDVPCELTSRPRTERRYAANGQRIRKIKFDAIGREQVLLSLLPGTVQELTARSRESERTVQFIMKRLHEEGRIRICDWRRMDHGGRPIRVYGAKEYPAQADAPCHIKPLTPSEWRKKRLATDEVLLQREAARRQVKKLIKAGGDEMINLLFGRVREVEVEQ